MTEETRTEPDYLAETRAKLMEAALFHAPFDGWSDVTWRAALKDSGVDEASARAAAPRRGLDLAVAFHRAGDAELIRIANETDLTALRYSERVAKLVRTRIEIAGRHREAVRRAATLFSLPLNAAEGARLIWGTADTIWRALGDTSEDFNWYSKRAILSGVYSSTLLYWLGDHSDGAERTWAFLDRRISGVMRFEKAKARARENPLARIVLACPAAALSRIRAPGARRRPYTGLPVGLPGRRR
ncbi:COQ9 family protein [Pikeienuella sp. HZG-20]|uniref:COQ9 family protein n=1 Tax=Paludibacillus litoralis TaxID=3133267 RepID=UPI0030EBCF5B